MRGKLIYVLAFLTLSAKLVAVLMFATEARVDVHVKSVMTDPAGIRWSACTVSRTGNASLMDLPDTLETPFFGSQKFNDLDPASDRKSTRLNSSH